MTAAVAVVSITAAQTSMPAYAATGKSAFSSQANASTQVAPNWGPLVALGGREWDGPGGRQRFNWIEPGRVLSWQRRALLGGWYDLVVLTAGPDGTQAISSLDGVSGTLSISPSGEAVIALSTGVERVLSAEGEGFRVRLRGGRATEDFVITRFDSPFTQTAAIAAVEAIGVPEAAPERPRSGPIILGAVSAPGPQVNRPASTTRPPVQPARPAASTGTTSTPSPSIGGGPIVVASAPPPPAAIRQAPRPAAGAPAARPDAPNSREALMQAQVATRREQAAREAEAERQRQYQIAENARIAEENRRAQEAANAAAWSEGLGFLGALVGGVAVGMQTGGDMASITAGMALGSSVLAPNSEMAAAANVVMQGEVQRIEDERAIQAQVIAELNNPDNPINQEARRRDADRETRQAADRERRETEERQEREDADREALLEQRMAEAATDRERQAELQQEEEARETARAEQQRRADAQREREAQQAREEQERRQEEERQRREQAEREAETRRQEQERQRAAAEAERTRLMDFKEGVTLCSLTGPQAQFNNWTCQGPLQMIYINFERNTWASAMGMAGCEQFRELPQAGSYRAFGCGYGIHPTSPGALRNVPEMLGVFVDGRITFRCPRNISGVCREQ